MSNKQVMNKLMELSKRVGFLFPSTEIYGGLRGSYDYGTLGVELKKNIINSWTNHTKYLSNKNILSIDTSLLNSKSVFTASGHLDNFCDELVDCLLSKERFRPDKAGPIKIGELKGKKCIKLIAKDENEAKEWIQQIHSIGLREIDYQIKNNLLCLFIKEVQFNEANGEGKILFLNQNNQVIEYDYNGYVSNNNSPFLTTKRSFNLMLKTFLDPIDPIEKIISSTNQQEAKESIYNSMVYLRPETAQGVFINYLYNLRYANNKLPFGVTQVGKSFRNELRVEHMIFRTLEFEQMEMEFFTLASEADTNFEFWLQHRFNWWKSILNDTNKIQLRQHKHDELAHYAKSCTDIEFLFPWGFGEVEGIANRTNFDLKQHMEYSKRSLTFTDNNNEEQIPHVIETSCGLNRTFLAVLIDALNIVDNRIILKLHPSLAPIKVAILPLVNQPQLNETAKLLYDQFQIKNVSSKLLDSQLKIGKRYYRMDEIGTPYCITIDYQTLEDNTVTLRFRDDQKQIRLDINQVTQHVLNLLDFTQELKPIDVPKLIQNNDE